MLKVDAGAEAIEGIVHANEYHIQGCSDTPIKDVPLPEGACIGAVVRHGEVNNAQLFC